MNVFNVCVCMSVNVRKKLKYKKKGLAPVVQKAESAIHQINHYPVDKY